LLNRVAYFNIKLTVQVKGKPMTDASEFVAKINELNTLWETEWELLSTEFPKNTVITYMGEKYLITGYGHCNEGSLLLLQNEKGHNTAQKALDVWWEHRPLFGIGAAIKVIFYIGMFIFLCVISAGILGIIWALCGPAALASSDDDRKEARLNYLRRRQPLKTRAIR
jgi:hypothetical protein